jgi:RimJ/RimL family protein N-acetyltransferase
VHWFEGIGFRPVEKKDLEDIRTLRNDPTTWVHLTDPTQISPAMQERWFESIEKAKDKAYFSIFKAIKEFPIIYTGDFLGIARFDQLDANNRSIRVGADIVPGERGKGYGTKALNGILKYWFDHMNFHRVWLCVLETNHVARKLYENVGLKEEGIMREAVWRDGQYRDYIIMSILEEEYRR